MKTSLAALLFFATLHTQFAAQAPANIRTFKNLPSFPRESLRNGVSTKFYRSLEISPVQAWVVVRAPLVDSRAVGAKVIRSDANGAYDKMAVELANELGRFSGLDYTESRIALSHVDVHLLVYKIADGTMVVAFWHIDDARYAGYRQLTSAYIGVLKNDGKWVVIEPPKRRR